MTEPISEERLAHLTAVFVDQDPRDWFAKDGLADVIRELLAEAKQQRERAETAECELAGLRDEWGVWYPGTTTILCDSERDARSRGPYDRHRPTVLRRKIGDWEEVDRRG